MMRLLIVGAGIGGLTLAAFLKDHEGFEIDIVEKAPTWEHLGFTIGIWDVGRRILSKLDLDDDFDKAGRRVKNYYLSSAQGKKVVLYHFEDFYSKYESAYTHISRSTLHGLLLEKSGTVVRMGVSVSKIEQRGEGIGVTFSDSTYGNYDLVIGADGVHSDIRTTVFKEHATSTGNRVWYAWLPERYKEPQTVTEYVKGKLMCEIFDDPHAPCMVLTAPETPGTFDDPDTRVARLRRTFHDFPIVQDILRDIQAKDITPTDVKFVDMTHWVRSRVVLIGDAAHAMEPFGGIGASMAMEDGYVLAQELISVYEEKNVSKALARYEKRRRPRITLARQNTKKRYTWMTFGFLQFISTHTALAKFVPISHFTKGYKKLLETQP